MVAKVAMATGDDGRKHASAGDAPKEGVGREEGRADLLERADRRPASRRPVKVVEVSLLCL